MEEGLISRNYVKEADSYDQSSETHARPALHAGLAAQRSSMSLAAEPDSAEFAILSTTDMHGKCWDTNVLTDGTESNNMLKVKTAVNQIRTELGDA